MDLKATFKAADLTNYFLKCIWLKNLNDYMQKVY